MTFFSNLKIKKGSCFAIFVQGYIQNNWLVHLFQGRNMMQDQNILKFDSENPDNTNSVFPTEDSLEVVTAKEEKPSRYVAKNQKIYSINDAKKFEDILRRHLVKVNEKSLTRNELLSQHKKTLLQLFEGGVTVEEILTFLQENKFTGITAENLKEILKKKK